MEEKWISFQQGKIFYKVYGKGTPIVLLHGFGEDSRIWDDQIDFLKENYFIIVPDIPGSGKSSPILTEVENQYSTMDDYADGIKKIIEKENIEKCVMIGHSMGGYISLAFAGKYQQQLLALGLFHSNAFADNEEKIETRKKGISFIEKNGAEAFLKTSLPGLFFDPEKNKNKLRLLLERSKEFSSKALIQYYRAMIARPDTTSILKRIKTPVLFIMGEHDKAIPITQSLEQSHFPQLSYIHILRNSGHMGMLEEKEKCNEILAIFLQNH